MILALKSTEAPKKVSIICIFEQGSGSTARESVTTPLDVPVCCAFE